MINDNIVNTLFFGRRSLIKNKIQTAVINILNLHTLNKFIKNWRFICTLHIFPKVTTEI